MNRIDQKFSALRKAGKKAFIAFITAGDPSLKATEELVFAIEKAGADIIELGVPFSDPMADGPTIQSASFRSLQNGTTLKKILATVRNIRRHTDIPIALMSYYNPVFHFGEKKFVDEAVAAGVDGVIIPDLPVDEAVSLRALSLEAGLSTVFFLAPTTEKDRVPAIMKASTGFVYFVSVAGVTGGEQKISSDIARQVRFAKTLSDKPICVGFGVSTPEQVKAMGQFADGVIVGSAIVKEIQKHVTSKNMPHRVASFVARLAASLK
jgi:tryptophan synthase alpha chain